MLSANESMVIDITISTANLNRIKLDMTLVIDNSSMVLLLQLGAISDMAGQTS